MKKAIIKRMENLPTLSGESLNRGPYKEAKEEAKESQVNALMFLVSTLLFNSHLFICLSELIRLVEKWKWQKEGKLSHFGLLYFKLNANFILIMTKHVLRCHIILLQHYNLSKTMCTRNVSNKSSRCIFLLHVDTMITMHFQEMLFTQVFTGFRLPFYGFSSK